MGLLSVLGKIGKGALNVATGGISGAIGDVLGGGAKASAEGRRGDADLQARMAALNNRALLDAAVFNRDLPGVRANQVARGDVLSTMHDAAPTGDPRIDKFGGGGLRPSAFGADTHQAGSALKRQALAHLMGGEQFTPQIATLPDSGLLEKIGGIAGIVGGVGQAIGGADDGGMLSQLKKKPVATMATSDPAPWGQVRF